MAPPPSDQARWLSALTIAMVEALPRLHDCPADPLVSELVEALNTALAEGNLAIPLPSAGHRQALLASPLAQGPHGPLVVEGDQLLWRRWHQQRQQVIEALVGRAQTRLIPGLASEGLGLDAAARFQLDTDQQRAVQAVLEQQLVLLEGGPGTGKTSTVAAMLEAVRADQPGCRIHLAAPTGKATARLRAALASRNLSTGNLSSSSLPCSTLHRLLESQGERFGRNRHHPLALDLVVVDEVSMVDLALMQALLDALPRECRLVLVGDSAQLPPIGAGSVLLELAKPSQRERLGDAAIQLQTVYRNNGAIAAVARSLVAGSDQAPNAPIPEATTACLAKLTSSDNLRWICAPALQLPAAVVERLRAHQLQLQQRCQSSDLGDADQAAALLNSLDQLLVLTPLRRGRWGVEAIHRALLGEVAAAGPQQWPIGTPVLCQRNLVELGLANGDLGLVVQHHGERRLLFGTPNGPGPLWIHPAQLADAQPALALTIHKAQGSEAEEVWVLMAATGRPSQQLLYTALTRAKGRAVLITPDAPCSPGPPAAALASR